MTPSDKFLIVQPQNRIIAIQKVWMEYNLHSIMARIEQLYTPDLVEDWVARVIDHVVRGYGRESVAFEGEDAAFKKDRILF